MNTAKRIKHLNVGARKAITIMVAALLALALIPTMSFATENAEAGASTSVIFKVDNIIVKDLTVEKNATLTQDQIPTDNQITQLLPAGTELDGWKLAGDNTGTIYYADSSKYNNPGYQNITAYVVSGDVTFVAQTSALALDFGSEAKMTGLGDSASGDNANDTSVPALVAGPIASEVGPAINAGTGDGFSGTGDGSVQNDSALDSDSKAKMAENDESALTINPILKSLEFALTTLATPGITDEFTVTFEANSATYQQVTVAKDQAAPAVANPSVTGKVFTGWAYTDDTDPLNPVERSFVFTGAADATLITKDLTVRATFDDITHKVYFYSADPSTDPDAFVLFTDEVSDGATTSASVVDFPENLVPIGKVFSNAWRTPGAVSDFDFSTPITAETKLIPQLSDGYRVSFVSGGTAIDPQMVSSSTNWKATEPVPAPTRTGYSNPVWYDNSDFTGSPFNFNATISANTTLYAKWTGDMVGYTIVYWLEKPNIPLNENSFAGGLTPEQKQDADNFMFAYSDSNKATYAGTDLWISAINTNKINAPEANNAIRELLLATDYPSVDNLYSFSHSDRKVIAGNGTTVINAYFTRNVWQFNVAVDNYPNGSNATNATLEMKVNGQTLTGTSINYQFYTKVGLVNGNVGPSVIDESTADINVNCISNATGSPVEFSFGGWTSTRYTSFRSATMPSVIYGANSHNDSACTATFRSWGWLANANITPTRYYKFVESLDQSSPAATQPNPNSATMTEQETRLQISVLNKRPDGNGAGALSSYNIPAGKQIFDLYEISDSYFANRNDRQIMTGQDGFLPTYIGGWYSIPYNPNTTNGNCYQWEQTSGTGLFYQLFNGSPNRNDGVRYFFLARASFELTFDPQGGSAVPGYTGENAILFEMPLTGYQPTDPTKANAEFVGWYDNPNFTGSPFDFATTMPAGNVQLYAKWLEDPCNVTFYADTAGTVQVTDFATTVANGAYVANPGDLDPLDWARDNTDQFVGWFTKTSSGAFVPYSWDLPVEGDLALYARWNPPYSSHTITYDSDGGDTTAPVDLTKYASGSKAVLIDGSGLTKAGGTQVFIGWKLDTGSGASGPLYNPGSSYMMAGADVTFVAQYAPLSNAATLTFKQNATSTDTTSVNWYAHIGATVTYPDAAFLSFVKTGYTFAGWSTSATAQAADTAFTPLSFAGVNAGATLYAVWTPIPYTVTYLPGAYGSFANDIHPNLIYDALTPGFSGAMTAGGAPLGATGWEFAGWSPAVAARINGNATYTATWTPVPPTPPTPDPDPDPAPTYTVTYLPGGTNVNGLPAGANLEADVSYTVSGGIPTRQGYEFTGWQSSLGATMQAGETFTMPAADVELTAQWRAVPAVIPPTIITPDPVPDNQEVNNVVSAALEQDIPVLNIFGQEVPLIKPAGVLTWSLFDLICTLLALAVLIISGVYSIFRKEDGDIKKDNDGNPKVYRTDEDGNLIYKEEVNKTRLPFLIVTAIAAAIAVVLFILTQDITQPVVLFDLWSILFAVLLAAAIIFARVAFTKKYKEQKQAPDQNPNQAAGAYVA